MAHGSLKRVKRSILGGLLAAVLSAGITGGCGRRAPEAHAPSAAQPAPRPAPAAAQSPAPPDPAEPALSDVVQLTRGFERAGEAYFSPDTDWIVFQAAPAGQPHYDMYVARLRRRADSIVGLDVPVRISAPGSWNSCGYFSPDGRSLIFATTGRAELADTAPGGYQRRGGSYRWSFPAAAEIVRDDAWISEIARHGSDTPRRGAAPAEIAQPAIPSPPANASQPANATPPAAASVRAVELATRPLTDNDAYDAECAFSPDGRWIVFGSNRDGDAELYAMRSDGSDPVRLTRTKGYDGGPFFSPDGRRIVYRSDRKGNDLLQVFVADLAFSPDGAVTGIENERQLTDDANVNWGPFWHPGGRHLAYATSAHGHHNYEVYWMRDDGSGKTRITSRPGFDGLPVFSADGRYMMWSSKRTADNTTQVFVARFHPPKD